MTEEELMKFAMRGMRADVTDKKNAVKQAMTRMQQAFDSAPADGATRSRFTPVIDGLMETLVAFAEALERTEKASAANYSKGAAHASD